jgi:hypothetical protein
LDCRRSQADLATNDFTAIFDSLQGQQPLDGVRRFNVCATDEITHGLTRNTASGRLVEAVNCTVHLGLIDM